MESVAFAHMYGGLLLYKANLQTERAYIVLQLFIVSSELQAASMWLWPGSVSSTTAIDRCYIFHMQMIPFYLYIE